MKICIKQLLILLVLGSSQYCLSSEVNVKSDKVAATPEILLRQLSKNDLVTLICSKGKLDTTCLEQVRKMLDTTYEGTLRYVTKVNGVQYGKVLPLNPEILAYLMAISQNKKVLELGAARGENALILGLAGSEEVYINDINPDEVQETKKMINLLPKEIQQWYHTVEGDCMKVFEDVRYTELFDVIYARNIFHFFIEKDRDRFVQLVHRLLKPGGHLILSTNSAIQTDQHKKAVSKHPDAYIFKAKTPYISALGQDNKLIGYPLIKAELDRKHVTIMDYSWTNHLVILDNKLIFQPEFNALPEETQTKLLEYVMQLIQLNGIETLTKIGLTLDFHSCHTACYTRHTIKKPFEGTDLSLLYTLSTNAKGHTTQNQDNEASLTVILQKKGDSVGHKRACDHCKTAAEKLKRCGNCKKAYYCTAECQKLAWKSHKILCHLIK